MAKHTELQIGNTVLVTDKNCPLNGKTATVISKFVHFSQTVIRISVSENGKITETVTSARYLTKL